MLAVPIGDEIMTDDNASEVIATIDKSNSGLLKTLLNKLVGKGGVRAVLGAMNQKRINAACRHIETKRAEWNGEAEWVGRIDAHQYFGMMAIHGHDCWSDPDFVEAFMRDNPECRLKEHRRNYVNGFTAEKNLTTNGHEVRTEF